MVLGSGRCVGGHDEGKSGGGCCRFIAAELDVGDAERVAASCGDRSGVADDFIFF